jgi:hypothetical protein
MWIFKNDNALPVNSASQNGGVTQNELMRYVAQRYDDYLRQYLDHYVSIQYWRAYVVYIGCIL